MAIRVVYILDGKAPDVIPGAENWAFSDGFLKIFSPVVGAGQRKMMIEIQADYVFSVERVELDDGAKEAPEAGQNPPEEPEKAPEAPKKPRKRAKRA